jgi:phosphatidate phosphatase PAH1
MLKHPFKNPTALHDKCMETSGLEETYLNVIKATYSKPIVNIKLNSDKLKAIPLKSGARQSFQLSISLQDIIRSSS